MNSAHKKTHINVLKSPSKVALTRSKSTDHLVSTHQKSISRKNNIEKSSGLDVSEPKIAKLSKQKSVKSLKSKVKVKSAKNSQSKSSKKLKNKTKKNNQSDCKTIKKRNNFVQIHMSQQSFNSIQSLKPKPIQYFLYQNNYIPIENSAQRRFVIKIKQIDLKNEQTSDTFYNKPTRLNEKSMKLKQIMNKSYQIQSNEVNNGINQHKDIVQSKVPGLKQLKQAKDASICTQAKVTYQSSSNTTPRQPSQCCIQTIPTEQISKCFSQTLTDLQFLYLPQQKHFRYFSKQQRLHYKQLFQSIANKIWTAGEDEELTEEKMHVLLYQRECVQMGMIQYYVQDGFPTHFFAVMSYLTNLFSYAHMNYKEHVLQNLHQIYGFAYQQRFSKVLAGKSTKSIRKTVLDQEIFENLQQQLFKQHDFSSDLIEASVHIHNKVLFDAANQQLQRFRPYYNSDGQPFPWSTNLGLTFFSIDEQCLHLLFKQIKQKLTMKFGSLCGILVDYDEYAERNEKHPLHIKKLEQNEQKMITEDIVQLNFAPQLQETDISLKADISTWILADLIQEICTQVLQTQLFQ